MSNADSEEAASETFSLADAIRGHSVQQASAASSARMLANDPVLADLVRRQQDLTREVNARLGLLNNVLSLPPEEREENGIKAIKRADRQAAQWGALLCSVDRDDECQPWHGKGGAQLTASQLRNFGLD